MKLDLFKLNNDELDVLVAEICGDKILDNHEERCSESGNYYECLRCGKRRSAREEPLTGKCVINRYSTDLNAMHTAEATLDSDVAGLFEMHLVINKFKEKRPLFEPIWHTSARLRAITFIEVHQHDGTGVRTVPPS